ncbi:hypothetical protein Poly51_07580 [Rubripirellula tenax]|uniref:Uncharacterized protein n=1 Tax=Rubripirellula tenax TaxID=2528015 RepID=A0A5C6FLU4_9BACT|nr:hypothetical protein [Rubripirellula tenax]TWU60482.1 hypothetical protein Poly51_07580 [Rubripirellula tenax]
MKTDFARRLRCKSLCVSAAVLGFVVFTSTALANPPAIASSVTKAIVKYFGKEGASEAAEYLSKTGGRQLMQRVSATAAREGGEETVERVAALAGKHGPQAIAALDNAPAVTPILTALDDLPAEQVGAAITQLAAGAPGRELAQATMKFGSKTLQSELKHPGVGLVLVRSLGDDGADLAAKLGTDQAIVVARHADDLSKLPTTARQGMMSMMREDATRMVQFMGRFAEANPGKTLFTVATTAVILAEPERILGGDEIVFDADGNPIVVSKSGLIGRTVGATGSIAEHVSSQYVRPAFLTLLTFVTAFAALWAGLKLWHAHKHATKAGD